MEAVNLKTGKNIIDAYGLKPSLNYDIEGILVQKEGKNIKIEKNIDNEKVYFSIRLKEEINEEIGQSVKIKGEDILSYGIDKPKEENNITIDNIIKDLGLEVTEENKEALQYLMENGIEITRENIDTFLTSKGYLKEIMNNLDISDITKLLDMGIDLMDQPLHKVFEALSQIRGEKSFSFRSLFKYARALSYKEAENIARDIYGRKMGKDVYEAIIALSRENMPVNKENIERVLEVVNKLYDLKDSSDQVFVKALSENITLSIENLYKTKHSYKVDKLNKNVTSTIYEEFTVEREASYEDILKMLNELNIETNVDNINLAREFLLNEVQLTDTNFQKVVHMKNTLKELTELLDKENIARLISEGIDPAKEDITNLVENIKDYKDSSIDISSFNVDDILEKIDTLKEITDRELVYLIKRGEDFKLENLKRIIDTETPLPDGLTKNTLEKAATLSNIFNTLGDLDLNTISLATKRYKYITLNNLYESSIELAENPAIEIKPVDEARESLIRQEYLNIRKNTTINLIKESIKEGVSIEDMPLEELHEYIYKNNNRHKEGESILRSIKTIEGKEEYSVLAVMKKNLNMTLKEISEVNTSLSFDSFFNGDKENGRHERFNNYKLLKKISKNDLVVQMPVNLGDELSSVNLIMPNMKEGINTEDMTFYMTMTTEKLGHMEFGLKVKENKIYLEFEASDNEKIVDNISFLEERFNGIGYELEIISPRS